MISQMCGCVLTMSRSAEFVALRTCPLIRVRGAMILWVCGHGLSGIRPQLFRLCSTTGVCSLIRRTLGFVPAA